MLGAFALPAVAQAARQQCTAGIEYDSTIPTWDQFFADHPELQNAIVPFAAGAPGRSTGKNTTANLDRYFQGVTAVVKARRPRSAAEIRERVAIKEVMFGTSELGIQRASTAATSASGSSRRRRTSPNFDADAAFWADVRDGRRSEAEGLAAVRSRPAIGWVTATPHGNEPAAGEAIARQLLRAGRAQGLRQRRSGCRTST